MSEVFNAYVPDMISEAEYYALVAEGMRESIVNYTPDLDVARKRIEQFHQDQRRCKEINRKLAQFGFGKYIFHHNDQLKQILDERRKLDDMRIRPRNRILPTVAP